MRSLCRACTAALTAAHKPETCTNECAEKPASGRAPPPPGVSEATDAARSKRFALRQPPSLREIGKSGGPSSIVRSEDVGARPNPER